MVIKNYFSMLLFCVCLWNPAWSQDDDAETIGRWYLEQRFLIADNDLDETLDPPELKIIQGEFAYYLNGNFYEKCDLNRDGVLSRDEVNKHAIQEWNYRLSSEAGEIARLQAEYPALAKPDVQSLISAPGLMQKLLNNYTWTSQHPALVFEIMSNRTWLSQNPQAIKVFHFNFRWLVDFPQYALRFYKMREWGSYVPELREWRKNHLAFLGAHPQWGRGDIQIKLPDFLTPLDLDITDNNQINAPAPLVSIPYEEDAPTYERFNRFSLEDSIRVLQSQLSQERLNAQRQKQKFETLQEQLRNAEYEQNTHLSQMRSERETLITTAERQRKEIQDLRQELALAGERLNQYIDLTSSGSDGLRDEAVQLKAENKKLAEQLRQLETQKNQLLAREANRPTTPPPGQLHRQDSLITANLRLEKDISRLGQELSRLAEGKALAENERDALLKAKAVDHPRQMLRLDSLLATSRQQSEEIRELNLHLRAMQESYEAQLQIAYQRADSVAAFNQMLSANQVEMKSDVRRLVRENAVLSSELDQLRNAPQSASSEQAQKDSLLFEVTRRQRELAILRGEMEKLRDQLNVAAPAATGPATSPQEASLVKQLDEKTLQLQQMTDKFIEMAAEVQQVRKDKSQQNQPTLAPQQADSLNQLLIAQRKEIASWKTEAENQKAYARRSRMVFDSLVALTSKLPELEAGKLSAAQDKESLSQAEVDLQKAQRKISEMEFEGQKLREQLDLALKGNVVEKDAFQSRIEVAQATIRELNTEVKKLQASSQYNAQQSQNQDELLRLRQQLAQLEQKNLALQKQFEASSQYVDNRLTTIDRLTAEVQEQKAEIARLTATNRTLSSRLNTDMVSRTVHVDSMAQYRSRLAQLNQQIEILGQQRISEKAESRRQTESLEHQITQIEMKHASQNRINQVNDERLEKIKKQEAEIKEGLASIDERERLLRQQETYIMGRLDELDKKEKRYQHLLQLETELRLLEQRLKQHPSYDQMRDQIRREGDISK